MKLYSALSVVYPAGDLIRSGEKTLEIRQWRPESLPLRDLIIVQNKIRLSSAGVTEDPEGEAVAIVDIDSVEDWREDQIAEACATYWEPGWTAWKLTNVRPLKGKASLPARLRIYAVEVPGG